MSTLGARGSREARLAKGEAANGESHHFAAKKKALWDQDTFPVTISAVVQTCMALPITHVLSRKLAQDFGTGPVAWALHLPGLQCSVIAGKVKARWFGGPYGYIIIIIMMPILSFWKSARRRGQHAKRALS